MTRTTNHPTGSAPASTLGEACPWCGEVVGVHCRESGPGSDTLHCAECGHEWTIAIAEPAVAGGVHSGPRPDTLTDRAALDAIAHLLRDPRWGVAMLEDIAELVARTGRDLSGDGAATWARH